MRQYTSQRKGTLMIFGAAAMLSLAACGNDDNGDTALNGDSALGRDLTGDAQRCHGIGCRLGGVRVDSKESAGDRARRAAGPRHAGQQRISVVDFNDS